MSKIVKKIYNKNKIHKLDKISMILFYFLFFFSYFFKNNIPFNLLLEILCKNLQ